MAFVIFGYSLFTCLAFFSLTPNFCHSFNPKLLNVSKAGSNWHTTDATWYGGANGAGSDGGSCGYETAVESSPFSSKITAVAPSLYNSGNGCGTCYQVKCTSSSYCSGTPVTVVVTDSCPGCDHLFDLSGTSFGAMAKSGQAGQLRNAGRLQIQYKSVDCKYPGAKVAFRVDPGSNPYYLAIAVEYADGHGITGVELSSTSSSQWLTMQPSWGALWKADLPSNYRAPFSIRVHDRSTSIVAKNVIPANWAPGTIYKSVVNFNG